MEPKVLAVDDIQHFSIQKPIWNKHGIPLIHAANMPEAIDILSTEAFAIVSINANCIEFLPFLKIMHDLTPTPIHVLTSDFNVPEKIQALRHGAVYYGEWLPKIEDTVQCGIAWLQVYGEIITGQKLPVKYILYDDICFYPDYFLVAVKGKAVYLTRKEFYIMRLLIQNRQRVYTFEQLYMQIWNDEYMYNPSGVINSHIKRLRKKLKDASGKEYIRSVYGVGYSFD